VACPILAAEEMAALASTSPTATAITFTSYGHRDMKTLLEIFQNTQFRSLKQDNYFHIYEKTLGKFRNRPIVFVEIGTLHGGSLFMWRDYFGPEAEIIGIDMNPEAKKWEKHGFRIIIGDQSKEEFWDRFFEAVGDIDVLIDDGGHTNDQQIVTLSKAVDHIKDDGVIIVEDVHTSYMKEFGNPSNFSFMSYAKRIIDHVNGRHWGFAETGAPMASRIFSMEFYESVVVLNVSRERSKISTLLINGGAESSTLDYRFNNTFSSQMMNRIAPPRGLLKSLLKRARLLETIIRNWTLRSYFNRIKM